MSTIHRIYTPDFKELKRNNKLAIPIAVISLVISLIALGISVMSLIK